MSEAFTLPDLENGCWPEIEDPEKVEALDITTKALLALTEDVAVEGGRIRHPYKPFVFHRALARDGERCYVTRYFKEDGTEVEPGEKMADIVIASDEYEIAPLGDFQGANWSHNSNYYFVNEGTDENGEPKIRFEEHVFVGSADDILEILQDNHITGPEFEEDNKYGNHIVTEAEALTLAGLFAQVLQKQDLPGDN